jgi:3-methyladenine DNA glycosylase AlkC
MAIGARDYIDQLLVKKYAQEKVDNHESMVSAVNPEKMMSALNDYASMSRNMFALSQKLQTSCARINARTARYSTVPIEPLKMFA